MEREIERLREREPRQQDYAWNEAWYEYWQEERRKLAAKPRVLRYENVPWGQAQQSYRKVFAACGMGRERGNAPIHSLDIFEQILPPGGKSGKHRHFAEALFYIVEGRGWEVHDEVRWPWEAGDIMCVPTYCIHQHFADPSVGARLFFVIPRQFWMMGLGHVEQLEAHPGFEIPPGAQPLHSAQGELVGYQRDGKEFRLVMEQQDIATSMYAKQQALVTGAPDDTYETYLATLTQEAQWRKSCPHVVKASDRPWEETRMGRLKYLLHPTKPGGMLTVDAWMQYLPPGGRSGKHRHVAEEVHKILEGRGYEVLDGVRHDWKAEDVVCIPSMAVHQHFNASNTEPAVFYAVQPRLYAFVGHGGVEHLEDAPGFSSRAWASVNESSSVRSEKHGWC